MLIQIGLDDFKRGDWIVCITNQFENFTYGKKYQILAIYYNVVDVVNDIGENPITSIYGWDGDRKVYYFTTVEKWREMRIQSII